MKGLLWIWLSLICLAPGWGADGNLLNEESHSLRWKQTVDPIFPRTLLSSGITSGWSRVVVDVDEKGQLQDWLVVGHTNAEFGDSAVSAIKHWQFQPMVIQGRSVPSTTLLNFEFEAKGVVIDIRPGFDPRLFLFGETIRDHIYRPRTLAEIDRIPVPLHWVDPTYHRELRERGVVGSATVEFYIDETGAVRMPAVAQADFPELGDLLATAVRQWQFEPPTVRGRPVLVHASQTVIFGRTEE